LLQRQRERNTSLKAQRQFARITRPHIGRKHRLAQARRVGQIILQEGVGRMSTRRVDVTRDTYRKVKPMNTVDAARLAQARRVGQIHLQEGVGGMCTRRL